MVTDRHSEELDFDVPVTVVRRDDLGRHFQTVRADPDGVGFGGLESGDHRRFRERFAPTAAGLRLGSGERRRETPAADVPHVTHGIAARALARGHVFQADGFDVGRQLDGVER